MKNSILKITLLFLGSISLLSCSKSDSDNPSPSALSAPINLSATAISSSEINLSWVHNSKNTTGFKVERKTGSESYAQIATTNKGETAYSDTGLNASTSYNYRVRAYNTDGDSGYSNDSSAETSAVVSENGKAYYIDATNGNDTANGTSEATAWKTLSKVNGTTFGPGDKILFKSGEVWNGQLLLSGSGSNGKPIIVDYYGTGNKPILNGGGVTENDNTTVRLKNGAYWEINNLEITNTNGSTAQQGPIWGLRVIVDNGTVINHIYIRNCYIHDVNGNVAGKDTGGIYVTADGSSPAFYNDLQIQNNLVKDVGGLGIATQSPHASVKVADRYPFLNVKITGNTVGPTGRNNMIVRASDDAIVEHNRLINSSVFDKGHSIFNFNTVNCQIQYNEAYGNVGPIGLADRGGFDADYNCKDTKIQYNYSHDNNWGYAIMKRAINENVTIRYNISENDKLSIYFYGFEGDKGMTRANIYNNTHFVKAGLGVAVFRDRTPFNTNFYNNIFYFEGTNEGLWGKEPNNCTFENNAFYNITTRGTNAVTGNPLLEAPGTGGQDIDWSNYPNVLTGYKIKAGSPCIDAGKDITGNGGKDFWGNTLYNGSADIGAHERQ
ncbi:fibronectin type III domain-containing protein [Algibacter sp. 2305UL17-15]|uniref:fibronectin type III domain-containing protein n=1 Tax=Algibacter sp. 2305UL17-15 TaxID=3231268 RepID=UPI003457A25A